MTSHLLQQLRPVYQSGSGELEHWQIAHFEAMACLQLEEVIELGLSLLAMMHRRCELQARLAERKDRQSQLLEQKDITEWYHWWLTRSEPLLDIIQGCEAAGYEVARADQFRTACDDVALLPLDFDRVKSNVEDLEAGKGVPFEQAMNELQN
jgi:hypothetical protein